METVKKRRITVLNVVHIFRQVYLGNVHDYKQREANDSH